MKTSFTTGFPGRSAVSGEVGVDVGEGGVVLMGRCAPDTKSKGMCEKALISFLNVVPSFGGWQLKGHGSPALIFLAQRI